VVWSTQKFCVEWRRKANKLRAKSVDTVGKPKQQTENKSSWQ